LFLRWSRYSHNDFRGKFQAVDKARTLVNIDATPGILTAAHVVTVSGWDNSVGVEQALVTSLDRRASFLWERTENLDWWISKPVDPAWGPDLAFIRLPTSGPFIEQIKGKKSFWPLMAST
jgi:hypothetical protein